MIRDDMIPAMGLPLSGQNSVRFRGRVVPESLRISIGVPRRVRWQLDVGAAVTEFEVSIIASQVVVDCSCEGPFVLGDLFRRAFDIAQTMVDLVAFAKGISVMVVLDTVTHKGKQSPLVVYSPGVEHFCTAFSLENGFDDVLKLVMEEPALFIALSDLNNALSNHHLSPVNYGRVVESIRTMIAGDGPAAWEAMRAVLRVDKPYLKLVTDTSIPKRHGNHLRVEADVVAAISERAWRIMDRFIIYRLRGGTPLPDAEFPMLTG